MQIALRNIKGVEYKAITFAPDEARNGLKMFEFAATHGAVYKRPRDEDGVEEDHVLLAEEGVSPQFWTEPEIRCVILRRIF